MSLSSSEVLFFTIVISFNTNIIGDSRNSKSTSGSKNRKSKRRKMNRNTPTPIPGQRYHFGMLLECVEHICLLRLSHKPTVFRKYTEHVQKVSFCPGDNLNENVKLYFQAKVRKDP